jgi:hypothetical protein
MCRSLSTASTGSATASERRASGRASPPHLWHTPQYFMSITTSKGPGARRLSGVAAKLHEASEHARQSAAV